jgi:hypothetical protein
MQVYKTNDKLDSLAMGKMQMTCSIKRVVETIDTKEVSEDISKFTKTYLFEEILFLMYETLKKLNN